MKHIRLANELIKSYDLFGFKIELNYNKTPIFRTTCGGVMSILI